MCHTWRCGACMAGRCSDLKPQCLKGPLISYNEPRGAPFGRKDTFQEGHGETFRGELGYWKSGSLSAVAAAWSRGSLAAEGGSDGAREDEVLRDAARHRVAREAAEAGPGRGGGPDDAQAGPPSEKREGGGGDSPGPGGETHGDDEAGAGEPHFLRGGRGRDQRGAPKTSRRMAGASARVKHSRAPAVGAPGQEMPPPRGRGLAGLSGPGAVPGSGVDGSARPNFKGAASTSNAGKAAGGQRVLYKSLGVDFGEARTGVAVSFKGVATQPIAVLLQKGGALVDSLLRMADEQGADEFVVGIPLHWKNPESPQAAKCRAFAGRLASEAAERGLRVYLHDEWKSTYDAQKRMLTEGVGKRSRREQADAYAASVLLDAYFDGGGRGTELVVPVPP